MHTLLLGLLVVAGETAPRCQLSLHPPQPMAGQDATLTITMPDNQWVANDANPDGAPQPLALRHNGEEDHAAAGQHEGEYVAVHRWTTPGSHQLVVIAPETRFTVTVVPTGSAPPQGKAMTKAEQVHCMQTIGKAWAELRDALVTTPVAWQQASLALATVRSQARRLSAFGPRQDPQEFRELAKRFAAGLDRCAMHLTKRDAPATTTEVDRTDGELCTRCHLKFQWDVVKDLSHFPDLRIHPDKR